MPERTTTGVAFAGAILVTLAMGLPMPLHSLDFLGAPSVEGDYWWTPLGGHSTTEPWWSYHPHIAGKASDPMHGMAIGEAAFLIVLVVAWVTAALVPQGRRLLASRLALPNLLLASFAWAMLGIGISDVRMEQPIGAGTHVMAVGLTLLIGATHLGSTRPLDS